MTCNLIWNDCPPCVQTSGGTPRAGCCGFRTRDASLRQATGQTSPLRLSTLHAPYSLQSIQPGCAESVGILVPRIKCRFLTCGCHAGDGHHDASAGQRTDERRRPASSVCQAVSVVQLPRPITGRLLAWKAGYVPLRALRESSMPEFSCMTGT